MAFFNSDDENEQNAQGMNAPKEENQEEAQQQLSGGVSGPVPTGSQSQTAAAPKSSSSGMTGFQNYQKANQGAATSKLSGAASQNVANQGQQAKTGINQATQSFNKKVEAGTLANKDSAVNDVKSVVDAARNVNYQAPQTQPSAGTAAPVTEPINTAKTQPAALNNLSQDQTSRFQEVINAKYQGPESLRQSGDYAKASGNVSKAQTSIDQSKSAQGREELLRNMYGQTGNYTQGLNKLDAGILNASKTGVENLQNTAKAQGNLQSQLDNAQIASSNLAQNRTQEIADIRSQARNAFTEGKAAEEAATEARLAAVIKDWDKLPNYFKNLIRNSSKQNQSQIDAFKKTNNYDTILANTNKAQAELKEAESFWNELQRQKGMGINYTNSYMRKAEEAYNNALAKYNKINTTQNALEKQLNALSSTYAKGNTVLSPEEAAILGVSSGEGLYNLGANAIKTAAADKNKLISKDEQLRQATLAALAGLDQDQLLNSNLKYANADLAGTQTAMDALDTKATRKAINAAETAFRKDAANNDLVGEGSKKNKTSGKTYSTTVEANLKDVLEDAGYNFDSKLNKQAGNKDLLRALANQSNGTSLSPDRSGLEGALGAELGGIGGGDNNQLVGQVGNYAGGFLGGLTGANLLTGALGMGGLGDAISGVLGGGANSKASKSKAKELAYKDLQNQLENAIQSSGFQNRIAVADDKKTQSRAATLQKLLNSLDKTNS